MVFGGGIKVFEQNARFADDASGVDFAHLVHMAQVHHAAAFKGHGLTVISGACAACGDGDIVFVAGFEDFDDFGFRSWTDDEIGGDVVEAIFQDR